MQDSASLEIFTLGGLSLRRDGEPVTGLASRKVDALLVYLACTGRAHPREVLAELFWEERTQAQAMSNLREALSSLRKHLKPFVTITRDSAALNPEAGVWLDVAEMERKLSGGQLERGVELYRGDFLEGFFIRGVRGFEDWASVERERLRQLVLDALGDLVAGHLEGGSYKAGIPFARRLLQIDPFMEAGHRQLMRLLAYSGGRGAALAQYETCCQVLQDELGVDPTAETRALYEQIQAGEWEAARVVAAVRSVRGYELRERIGVGGFGGVYRAYQPSVGREVAVKVILPHYADHPGFIRRFEREAQLVARLEHPHIVPLYDYWREPDGTYLVMRWLRGGNLHQSLQRGPWSAEAAARLLDQLAGALSVAHRQGVVHRDVKPENILLDEEGNAYLSDFGIAKDLMRATITSETGAIVGSLGYVSPEQVQGEPVTAVSDLYSLGVVMYEVLTGEHPYAGLTPTDLLIKCLNEPLPSLGERRADLPEGLEAVIQRATAKDPGKRHADVAAFARAFRAALTGTAVEAILPPSDAVVLEAEIAIQPPPFLEEEMERDASPRPVFVAREAELERLNGFLAAALEGQGAVVFVIGEPGVGKTALMEEFALRAMDQHPQFLVASGSCNAYSGLGDPYLPFRDVLGMLTGDVESRWAAGAVTREHARRLWAATPLTAQALMEHGPYLVDTFFSGPALLSRARAAGGEGAPWLRQVKEYVERQRGSATGLEQSHLFQQLTNVLQALAEEYPLLLILDDLQWADQGSIGLLFHLGRRLADTGARILITAAYRPEEVALGRDGQRHPLEKALAEFKRQFGDVWVDLAQVEESAGREFVEAFLETEPNRLGESFRGALFQHTGGHPLFTIELLRAMQERGDLVRDEAGRWIVGREVDWGSLPARVEGVIEERIGRLERDLREILSVASVEGEAFTAQVVARVQELGERGVLRALSQELEKRHHLVREQGELAVERQRLSRYRFAHALFQQYLYDDLGEGERRMLHREIAAVLEELYAEKAAEIAAQLVRHYAGAGDGERERHYARLAGERAAAGYAHAEALRHLSRALELTPEGEPAERYTLLLAREKVYDRQGEREAQRGDLAALEAVAAALADPRKRAAVALRRAWHACNTSDYPAVIAASRAAIDLVQPEGDPEIEAEAHRQWGWALVYPGKREAGRRKLEQGLARAREARSTWLEAEILRQLSNIHSSQGDVAQAAACLEGSLSIFRELGDRFDEMRILLSLSLLRFHQSEYQEAQEHIEEGLRISRELGARPDEAFFLNGLGTVLGECGDYETAQAHYKRCLGITREIGARQLECTALANLGEVAHYLNQNESALSYNQQALAIAREIGSPAIGLCALTFQGAALEALGQVPEAAAAYQEGADWVQDTDVTGAIVLGLDLLARASLARGDLASAMTYVEQILGHLESGSLEGVRELHKLCLGCYRVLRANGDPRAGRILDTAYRLLQERAAKIKDERLRRSFLENVPDHREIVKVARLDQS